MKKLIPLLITFILLGCNSLTGNFKDPQITVKNFRMLPLSGITPEFEIALTVKNPNDIPLILKGLDYTVLFNGDSVVSGVSTSLPVIAPQGEGVVKVKAKPDFFGGFGVIKNLLKNRSDAINYSLDMKLDLGSLSPKIPISRKGKFSLSDLKNLTNII